MRIHLLCDHKWRDLPNLVALKLMLQRYGHKVLISTTKDAAAMIAAFRPDCVVLNHLFAPSNQQLAKTLRENGIAVVVLPTEGAVRPELRALASGEFAKEWAMDVFLAWGKQSADDVQVRWSMSPDTVPVIGCARFDFYTDRFRNVITPRTEFCRVHHIDPTRPIVTWASAYAFADVARNPADYAKFAVEAELSGVAECLRRINVDPTDVPRFQAEGRAATLDAFVTLAKARADIQFIIRPHPVEPRAPYREAIKVHGLRNVRFCPDDYIWNVLNAADVHLHRHCTTAIEAWLWQKPTVEMGMDRMEEQPWEDREVGSDFAHDTDELIGIVGRYIDDSIKPSAEVQIYRQRYITEWFGPPDGRSCERAAAAIHGLLEHRVPRRFLKAVSGLSTNKREMAAAVARYALNRLPNQSLLRPQSAARLDPQNKQITRRDIGRYEARVASAVFQ